MIKKFKVKKAEKGECRLGVFGGSILVENPKKLKGGRLWDSNLKNEEEGLYRNYYAKVYLIKVQVDLNLYRKIN